MADELDNPPRRRSLERWLEAVLFNSRWVMAPFYLGLVLVLVGMLYVFVVTLVKDLLRIESLDAEGAILMGLSLVDLSLAGNLVLLVIFAGYENFVSKMHIAADEDRPAWMGTIDFSGLKVRLIASIVAISAISLLRTFMAISEGHTNETELKWQVIVLMAFVSSGVLLALMDAISSRTEKRD